MGKDFPLLWKVYDHIVAHPKEWDQYTFVETTHCGTTFCFAGHAVMMARPDVTVEDDRFLDRNGDEVCPEMEARRLLGLTDKEAHRLFYTFTSDPTELRDIILDWASA